jgi:hypothetical protein
VVSDEAKNVIPLKFLRQIKNKKKISSCKLNPGTYCIFDIKTFDHTNDSLFKRVTKDTNLNFKEI